MSLFHVYNKFDTMDCVVVTAKSEIDALVFAIRDNYLTGTLAVNRFNLVVWPLANDYSIGQHERHIRP